MACAQLQHCGLFTMSLATGLFVPACRYKAFTLSVAHRYNFPHLLAHFPSEAVNSTYYNLIHLHIMYITRNLPYPTYL